MYLSCLLLQQSINIHFVIVNVAILMKSSRILNGYYDINPCYYHYQRPPHEVTCHVKCSINFFTQVINHWEQLTQENSLDSSFKVQLLEHDRIVWHIHGLAFWSRKTMQELCNLKLINYASYVISWLTSISWPIWVCLFVAYQISLPFPFLNSQWIQILEVILVGRVEGFGAQ